MPLSRLLLWSLLLLWCSPGLVAAQPGPGPADGPPATSSAAPGALLETCRDELLQQVQRTKNCQVDTYNTTALELRELVTRFQQQLASRQQTISQLTQERDALTTQLEHGRTEAACPPHKGTP